MVPQAGPADSLYYYVRSKFLFLDDLDFDDAGIARKRYRAQGPQYNPLFIAWWGLVNLDKFLLDDDKDGLQEFLTQVNWLAANAVEREGDQVVWPCYFYWQEGLARLSSPWISAMYNGVVISALVRAYRITKEEKLLDLCERGTRIFELPIGKGGVRTVEGDVALYEEYPIYPLPRVLDGFLFSLLGLYDLAMQTGSDRVRRLFDDGVTGAKHMLSSWDYRGKWSWYGTHGYLCPPHYHKLNGLLLLILAELTKDRQLAEAGARWNPTRLSRSDKAEIYLMYAMTKNLARLRLPRN